MKLSCAEDWIALVRGRGLESLSGLGEGGVRNREGGLGRMLGTEGPAPWLAPGVPWRRPQQYAGAVDALLLGQHTINM